MVSHVLFCLNVANTYLLKDTYHCNQITPQAIKAAEEHITSVTEERSYYWKICEDSKQNVIAQYTSANGSFEPPPPHSLIRPVCNDTTIHYSSQQVRYLV